MTPELAAVIITGTLAALVAIIKFLPSRQVPRDPPDEHNMVPESVCRIIHLNLDRRLDELKETIMNELHEIKSRMP